MTDQRWRIQVIREDANPQQFSESTLVIKTGTEMTVKELLCDLQDEAYNAAYFLTCAYVPVGGNLSTTSIWELGDS